MGRPNAQSLFALAFITMFAFGSTAVIAGNAESSGTMDATYVKRDMLPAGDQEGHVIMLTEAVATNSNGSGTRYLDRFTVSIRETADLTRGNGPHQGYVVFKKGGDQLVVRFEGMVTTTLNEDGTPRTSMKGEWANVKGGGRYEGVEGDGTYTGYFTAEDKFRVEWKGWHSQGELFASAR